MRLTQGSARIDLPLPAGHATDRLPVWTYLPESYQPGRRIVVVLHGTSRAARASRDNWVAASEAQGFVLAVPDFELRHFPDPDYAYGGLWDPVQPHRRRRWEDSHCRFLDDLVATLAAAVDGPARFTLYGHSAGAAFAHRYATFAPHDRLEQAIFANCGWYTLPDRDTPLPYGLADAELPDVRLDALLRLPVTVLVGDADRSGPYPGWWPGDVADHGPHRVARSETYFDTARREAARRGVPFGWSWQAVPGVAHENAKMIAPAARVIAAFGAGAQPSPAV